MRSYNPECEYDQKDLAQLNPPRWMVDLLALNPEYVHWGPGDDYMPGTGGHGWDQALCSKTWADFSVGLDELNEVVHWHFEIARDGTDCAPCEGSGCSPEALKLNRTFYGGWGKTLTQDDLDALEEAGRGNIAGLGALGGHDAINRSILVEARCKRAGIDTRCPECDGEGFFYGEAPARLQLVLWFIHPRKGASRGWTIDRVEREDLPQVRLFLEEAAKRNAERFSGASRLPGGPT